MFYFATLFDKNFLNRGIALINSLKMHLPEFKIFILCLDEFTFDFFKTNNFNEVYPVKLEALIHYFPELNKLKEERKWSEFIFTLSPYWPLYVLKKYHTIDYLTTLDADIYFFSSPKNLLSDFDEYSIQITPHNFSSSNKWKEKYGIFNVSFQSFRNDKIGLDCLNDWKNQCFDWCFDYLENDKFADQKYLDQWPEKYGEKLKIINEIGAGSAPWNIEEFEVSIRKGIVHINENPLIYYHFHNLRLINSFLVKTGLLEYTCKENFKVLRNIYAPYLSMLKSSLKGMASDKNIRNHKVYSNQDIINIIINGGACLHLTKWFLYSVNFSKPYALYKKMIG